MKKQYEKFVCQYCDKVFTSEAWYMKHNCEQMKRAEEIKTMCGQRAFGYYQRWMILNKRTPPHVNTFLTSHYYKSFIRFSQFVNNVQIPDVDLYIRLMLRYKLLPSFWTKNEMYNLYFEHVMDVLNPIKQVNISVKTLLQISDKLDIDTQDIINVLTVNEIVDLLQKRKLFPLILLNSRSFANKLSTATVEEKKILQTLIQPKFWSDKLADSDVNQLLQKYITELGI